MKPIPDFENDPNLTEKQKRRRREYYADREANIHKTGQWQKANPQKVRQCAARSRESRKTELRAYFRAYGYKFRERHKERLAEKRNTKEAKQYHMAYNKKRNLDIKQETIKAYGGYCACCGEDRIEFLSLDHKFGDGAERRRDGRDHIGSRFYKQLKREGFPQGRLRVLCYNCNGAHGYYGYCPHELEAKRLCSLPCEVLPITRKRLSA